MKMQSSDHMRNPSCVGGLNQQKVELISAQY